MFYIFSWCAQEEKTRLNITGLYKLAHIFLYYYIMNSLSLFWLDLPPPHSLARTPPSYTTLNWLHCADAISLNSRRCFEEVAANGTIFCM